jgi:hypothetical protein
VAPPAEPAPHKPEAATRHPLRVVRGA